MVIESSLSAWWKMIDDDSLERTEGRKETGIHGLFFIIRYSVICGVISHDLSS